MNARRIISLLIILASLGSYLLFLLLVDPSSAKNDVIISKCFSSNFDTSTKIAACGKLLDQVGKNNENRNHILLARAKAYTKGKHWDSAITDLDDLLATDSDNLYALRLKGWASYRSGDYTSAISALEKVVSIDPMDKDSFKRLVNALQSAKLYVDAENLSLRLVKDFPNESWAHFELGDSQMFLEKYDQAAKAYKAALDLNPSDLPAFSRLWNSCRLGSGECPRLELSGSAPLPELSCSVALQQLIDVQPDPSLLFEALNERGVTTIDGYLTPDTGWFFAVDDYVEAVKVFKSSPSRELAEVIVILTRLLDCTEEAYVNGSIYDASLHSEFEALISKKMRDNYLVFVTNYIREHPVQL